MPGVTGAEVKAAFAPCSTWGVPASVTRGILLTSTEGLDGQPGLVDDEAFNQTFLGEAEVGDHAPLTPELMMQLRYDDAVPLWLAAAMGSAAAPVVVSSVAADSLVAYSHVLTLANELTKLYTLAVDESQYILEVPSLKVRGFSIRVGENGRMMVGFQIVGSKGVYDSTVNINSTVAGATVAALGTRVFRKHGVFRMNRHGASALAAADANSLVKEITFGSARPLAQDDHTLGNDYIIEPDDDGFPEFPVELTYARMNTVTANSLAVGLKNGTSWKADLTFTSNLFINSDTAYSMLWQMPALQLYAFRAPITGHNQCRPIATFKMKLAASSPAGMAFVSPLRCTIVNGNSATLV